MTVDLERVLHEVNIIRQHSLHLDALTEIPRGNPNRSGSCPMARAFNATGLAEGVLLNEGSGMNRRFFVRRRSSDQEFTDTRVQYKEFILPDILNQFVNEFDQGMHQQFDIQHPELIHPR